MSDQEQQQEKQQNTDNNNLRRSRSKERGGPPAPFNNSSTANNASTSTVFLPYNDVAIGAVAFCLGVEPNFERCGRVLLNKTDISDIVAKSDNLRRSFPLAKLQEIIGAAAADVAAGVSAVVSSRWSAFRASALLLLFAANKFFCDKNESTGSRGEQISELSAKALNDMLFVVASELQFAIPALSVELTQSVVTALRNALFKAPIGPRKLDDFAPLTTKGTPLRPLGIKVFAHSLCEIALQFERMVDPGVWINSSHLLEVSDRRGQENNPNNSLPTASSEAPLHQSILDSFTSSIVHFVDGESSSGKTCCTLISGGKRTIVIYCTPSLPALSKGDIKIKSDSGQENNDTIALFQESIRQSLCIGSGMCFSMSGFDKLSSESRIHFVFDEMFSRQHFAHCCCRVWKNDLRQWAAKKFNCEVEQLYCTFIGTGIQAKESAVGSLPDTFMHYRVRPREIFFPQLLAAHCKKPLENDKSSSKREKDMLQSLLNLLFVVDLRENSDDVFYKRNPTNSISHRFLQIADSSPRCAVLVLRYVKEEAAKSQTSPASSWTQLLASWMHNVAEAYWRRVKAKMRDFDRMRCLEFALRVALNRQDSMTHCEWSLHVGVLGTLVDSAFWIKKRDFELDQAKNDDGPKYKQTYYFLTEKVNTGGDWVFVYLRQFPRFRVSEALVGTYLLLRQQEGSTSLQENNEWDLRAACIADYSELCAGVGGGDQGPPSGEEIEINQLQNICK